MIEHKWKANPFVFVTAFIFIFGMLESISEAQPPEQETVEYHGLRDASAAIAIGDDRFIVADDEGTAHTALRVYQRNTLGHPLAELHLSTDDLAIDSESDPELDLEGSAQIGDRIYWIGSHGTNKHGEQCNNRQRLFATRLHDFGTNLQIELAGKPYQHLLKDLVEHPAYNALNLARAAKQVPDENGLNIEGLAATQNGELLIGFRSPVIEGKALIARLKNPKGVLDSKPGKFGPPILLDLGGRGIRSIEWSEAHRCYFIIGGRSGSETSFELFVWSGNPRDVPQRVPDVNLADLQPEAIFFEGRLVTILSDDGHRKIEKNNRENAETKTQRGFRSLRLTIAEP